MLGLTRMPASGASLLLNAESVFTAVLAWFVFKTVHTHPHHHEPMTHTHEHYPDAHHQHGDE